MDTATALCFNCQAKLVLDESICEYYDDRQKSPKLSNQSGKMVSTQDNDLNTSGNLFDIICNSSSALKGPMCEECTERLFSGMDEHLKGLDEECAQYHKLIKQLEDERGNRQADKNILQSKLTAMKNEEAALLAESKKLEIEETKLANELAKRKADLKSIENGEEAVMWKSFRNNHRQLLDIEEAEQNLESAMSSARSQLDKFLNINALNSAFFIWQQGCFGTINGFRLGRLPHSQVEWSEINAACGQVALLLISLANRYSGFEFSMYKIVPMGNHSFIKCMANSAELPLYGSGGFKPFGQKKFDEGICALVECFCQLQKHMEGILPLRLPHRMHRDRIEDNKLEYSVKMQFNSEERWTKAMKCLLINFRWAATYVLVHEKNSAVAND